MKCIFLAIWFTFNLGAQVSENVPVGTVELVEGSADLERNGQSYSLSEDWDIYEEDIIRVLENSHVKIVLTDESTLDLPAKAKIKIASYLFKEKNMSIIELIFGEIRALVAPNPSAYNREAFHIKTKTVVVGVRGTDFLTSIDETSEDVEVTTFEGEVEVGEKIENNKIVNGQKIRPGFFMRAQRGRPLQAPSAMDKQKFQDRNNRSFRAPNLEKRRQFQQGKLQEFKRKQMNHKNHNTQQMVHDRAHKSEAESSPKPNNLQSIEHNNAGAKPPGMNKPPRMQNNPRQNPSRPKHN